MIIYKGDIMKSFERFIQTVAQVIDSGYNKVIIRFLSHYVGHHRYNLGQLVFTTPGQQGNHRLVIRDGIMINERAVGLMRFNCIEHRVTHIVDIPVKLFIELLLKWENNKQSVNIGFDLFCPHLIPRPHFGWNVIEHLYAYLSTILGNAPIEPTIVNENNHIRLKTVNIFFALLNVSGESPEFNE